MTGRRTYWTLLLWAARLLVTASAQAQSNNPGQQPTLSPWFGLYQRNGGPLDNYHMFVRPRIELTDTLQRQQSAIQRNSAGIDSLNQSMLQEPGTVRPTGTGSVFMNYSHYYPAQGTNGQTTQSSATRRRASSPPRPSSGSPRH